MLYRVSPVIALPILRILTWVALATGLALPTFLPEMANVLLLAVGCLSLLLCSRSTNWRNLLKHPGVVAPLVAIVMLLAAFAATASTPPQILAVFYFAPLLLVAPVVALLERADRIVTIDSISLMASVGAAAAAIVALVDSVVLGELRAGTLVNNPIHFAALALIVGFVAVVGVSSERPLVRVAALVAPSLALLAVVLSGSRGPMFAALTLAPFAVGLILWRLPRRLAVLALCCLSAITVVAILVAWFTGVFLRFTVFVELPQLLAGGSTTDASTLERLQIYTATWRSFRDSPVFGHGLVNLTAPVLQYMPESATLAGYQHLHNDLADFAVAGGAIGVAAYLLILGAPLAEAIHCRAWRGNWQALYLSLIVSVGFFSMGLTNATFGILSQTTLYAFVVALVVYLCRAGAHKASDQLTSPATP